MIDLTSAIFVLDAIFDRNQSLKNALDRAYDRYNLTTHDRAALKAMITSELKHHLILDIQVRDRFPAIISSDQLVRLFCLGLDLLRNADGNEDRIKERTGLIVNTAKALMIECDQKDIDRLVELAEKPAELPAAVAKDPLANNAAVFNCPQWLLQNYIADFGPEKTIDLLKAQTREPELFLALNTSTAARADFASDERFQVTASTNPAYPTGALLRSLKTKRASTLTEVLKGQLFPQDLSWFSFLDTLPFPQYGKTLLVEASSFALPASLALRSLAARGQFTASFDRSEDLTSFEARMGRLSISETSAETGTDDPAAATGPTIETVASSATLLKTYLPFNAFDLVISTPASSRTGEISHHPEIAATFDPDQLFATIEKEESGILESSFFVAAGGYLAYAVTSLIKDEGERVVSWLVSKRPEFKLISQRYLVPATDYAGIGMYFAILRRVR